MEANAEYWAGNTTKPSAPAGTTMTTAAGDTGGRQDDGSINDRVNQVCHTMSNMVQQLDVYGNLKIKISLALSVQVKRFLPFGGGARCAVT